MKKRKRKRRSDSFIFFSELVGDRAMGKTTACSFWHDEAKGVAVGEGNVKVMEPEQVKPV